MAKRKNKALICMTPTCTREIWIRGLCRPCYAAAYRMVQNGSETWESLEEKGACLGAKRNPFREQWEEVDE